MDNSIQKELAEILQDIVYAQAMINRTVSRLNHILYSQEEAEDGRAIDDI